jgi:chloride channel protein, CIC family
VEDGKAPGRGEQQRRLTLEALAIGVAGALAARAFDWAVHMVQRLLLTGLAGYRPPGLPQQGGSLLEHVGPHGLWLIPIATTLGGLLSGWLVYTWAPEAEGHGTDVAVRAFHQRAGFVRARVPIVKTLASAIIIGSGGSAGYEGPTALITGGLASVYATWRKRSDRDRRILLLVGVAAGLSAIFRSPIGAAIFAVEVLYQTIEFEAAALFYTMLASIVAYAFNGLFVGWSPLFSVPPLDAPRFSAYGWYAALGVAGGIVAAFLPTAFYRTRDAFRALPMPNALKPALGALALGVLALAVPEVLGGGYGWIQHAIDGQMGTRLMLLLVLVKVTGMCLTISSGGSGGVFAPTLYVGAMLGGAFAQLLHLPAAAFVVVGMAAVFAGAARVPIATLLFVTEMTSGFEMLVAAALAVMLSYMTQSYLSRRLRYRSLYEGQVAGRADSPAHQVDQLRAGLRLLAHGSVPGAGGLVHMDLVQLIEAGVPVDLRSDQLKIATVAPDSHLVGQRIEALVPASLAGEIRVVAVLRGASVGLALPETVISAGDGLVTIVAPEGRAWFDRGFGFDARGLRAPRSESGSA